MDMVLVRLERAVSLADADQDDTHHIERRNNHGAESDEKGAFGVRHDIRVVLAVLYGKETEGIAQGKASRIAHENLAGTLHTAEHVVIEERHKHAESTGRKHGITPQTLADEQEGETSNATLLKPEARPSMPSIRLMALVMKTTVSTVKGMPT